MFKTNFLFFIFVLLSLTVTVPNVSAQPVGYDALIVEAQEALKQNDADAAFEKAQAAIAANAARHEGYFYAGVAAYRQNLLDAAEKYVNLALARAPEDQKENYRATLVAIGEKKQFFARVETAQKAEADGLYAKAAREYTAAWDAFPTQTEAGLKAAEFWSTRLNNPGEAARILNTILAQSQDEQVKKQARSLLEPLKPALQQVYTAKMQVGRTALQLGRTDKALQVLNEAAFAQPESSEVHLLLARVHAKRGDVPETTKASAKVLKAGPVAPTVLFAYAEFAGLLEDAAFVEWVNDALGGDALAQARGTVRKAEEEWREMSAPLNLPRQTKINPIDGAEMVLIPAGKFVMGSDEGISYERPQRKVYLDGYWIYKYPVTVGQYKRFCTATRRKMPDAPSWGWQDNHPMVNVSWHDAVAYSQWAGVRLPTEAQWEKAARGVDGRVYPWGNTYDRSRLRASDKEGGDAGSPASVGSYPSGASPWGIQDMAGNVWEWCADWFDKNYYKSAPSRNPAGPLSGERRVFRGCSWYFIYAYDFRTVMRVSASPDYIYNDVGFRCSSGP